MMRMTTIASIARHGPTPLGLIMNETAQDTDESSCMNTSACQAGDEPYLSFLIALPVSRMVSTSNIAIAMTITKKRTV
ncbi:MAG: hypothetical protein EAX95_15860 [Candidatus Thorarchaeota archaeon]|nr:hypothetical protein [Candidatus Thorarchaeota archaeon]